MLLEIIVFATFLRISPIPGSSNYPAKLEIHAGLRMAKGENSYAGNSSAKKRAEPSYQSTSVLSFGQIYILVDLTRTKLKPP